MISYNSLNFNNIANKIEQILQNKIDVTDVFQTIPIAVMHNVVNYVHEELKPVNKFVSVPCPKCEKYHLIPMESTYNRNIIFRVGNVLLKIKINISRLICENCGSTHAVLPDFCIPFKQYSNQAILSIVREASLTSTEKAANKLNIEPKQVRRFVNIVEANKNSIVLLYHTYINEFNFNIDSNSKLYVLIRALPNNIAKLYFKQFKSIFLYVHNKRKIYINYQKLLI